MRQIKSDDARRSFRNLLDEVERDHAAAISILRYDRPVAVMVSDAQYRELIRIREVAELAYARATEAEGSFLAEALREGMADHHAETARQQADQDEATSAEVWGRTETKDQDR